MYENTDHILENKKWNRKMQQKRDKKPQFDAPADKQSDEGAD